eukprot:1185020-Prorocentrum_minimum.AAC.1
MFDWYADPDYAMESSRALDPSAIGLPSGFRSSPPRSAAGGGVSEPAAPGGREVCARCLTILLFKYLFVVYCLLVPLTRCPLPVAAGGGVPAEAEAGGGAVRGGGARQEQGSDHKRARRLPLRLAPRTRYHLQPPQSLPPQGARPPKPPRN